MSPALASLHDPAEILKELIAIPSVNPMGRELSGAEYYEGRMTRWLSDFLQAHRLPVEVQEVVPGRCNVLTRLDSPGATRTVLFDVHQDTVPVDGMTIAPFTPTEAGGRISGRGACDVKGGMASMLATLLRLRRQPAPGRPNLVLSLTCDEESTSLGINHLTAGWQSDGPRYSLLPVAPDVAVIAEPTLLDIVVAHRGAVRWRIRTAGRACHSSRPTDGVNAIYRMARVLLAMEEFAAWLPSSRPAHPLCGPATLSVGLISGGSSVNVVPDGCGIDIDRRLLPGEDPLAARQEIIDWLAPRFDFELFHDQPWCNSPGLNDNNNQSLARELLQHVEAATGPHHCIGVPFGTHASRVAAAGVPAVVFGPGDIAQAHTKDEWIEVAQLHQATEILCRLINGSANPA
jgi:acetylornithine deacetylase